MDGVFNLEPHTCEAKTEPLLPALWLVIPSTVYFIDAIIIIESSKLKRTQNKKQLGFTFDFWLFPFFLSSPFPLTLAYLEIVSPTVTFP